MSKINIKAKNNSKSLLLEWVLFALMAGMLIASAYGVTRFNLLNNVNSGINGFVYLFVMLFDLLLYTCCILVHDDSSQKNNLFKIMIFLSFLSTFFGMAVTCFNGIFSMRNATVTAQVLNNSLLAVYWIVFWNYQKINYKRYNTEIIVDSIMTVYMALYIIFSVMNFFTPTLFSVYSSGILNYRADYFTITYLSIWYVIYIIYTFTRECDLKVKFTLASYVLFPMFLNVISFFLYNNKNFEFLYYPLTSLCFMLPLYLIYFNLHIEYSRRMLKQKQELTNAKINIMVSQIQPHFIYNSLTAIIDLIDKDTAKAKETIVEFSDYLRVNLNSLKEIKLVPFKKELEHIKTYLNFEQLRFDNISVEYDIETEDFLIPALTIQPLVENAVKHGVSKTGCGGKVCITTKRAENSTLITVSDNGVGFEQSDIKGGDHIGLNNVATRIKDMCGGTLKIESKKGEGTVVTVYLPDEGSEKQ